LAAGAAVTAIAFLHGRGGFDFVLGTTATIALGFVFATAGIAGLVNGGGKQRSRAVAPAGGPEKKAPALQPGPCSVVEPRSDQKSIPPPIPPAPGGMAGVCFFGTSATIASVVMSRPATEAASCNAVRTTLVGSMMPFDTRLPYSPLCASKPKAY